ncbi:MAG: methyltransferase domain-containing protein [Campylobacterales bacterium]|nr:methyltransferase domain-containing protein [Campylobacterales bacterium]
MALEDKEKWDKKHIQTPIPTEPIELVTKFARLAPGKQALDIACGMGRHAKYLARHGLHVDALDISSTAIDSLHGLENITAKAVDFDTYELPKNKYDLIVCTYYLERRLFPQIIDALKEGGIFIYETFLYHPDNEREPSKKRFMLNEGELEATFDDKLDLMHIREEWVVTPKGEKMMIGSLVGKKKIGGMNIEDFWS